MQLQTLDGRPLSVPITEPVGPQQEKVVPGEGMPVTKHPGQKGNLRIRCGCGSRGATLAGGHRPWGGVCPRAWRGGGGGGGAARSR